MRKWTRGYVLLTVLSTVANGKECVVEIDDSVKVVSCDRPNRMASWKNTAGGGRGREEEREEGEGVGEGRGRRV